MKVIIDIPKEIYELIVNDKDKLIGLAGAVQNGIPFDKIRAEIGRLDNLNPNYISSGIIMIDKHKVYKIIDKYKAESEESEDNNTRPYYANEWTPEDSLYVEQGMLYD